ncbi:MAG: TIGR00282 family metallophosphoesterase [Halanaerobiales bacterium]
MKVFFIGDIVGRTGRTAVRNLLPEIIKKENPDLIIANAENSAGGFGLTRRVADELFSYGIDILTMGNHTWDKKGILDFIGKENRIIRPLNYNMNVPGKGWTVLKVNDFSVAVINFNGQVFMTGNNSPFDTYDKFIEQIKNEADIIIIDFHAEATGEKLAFANYVDGQVAAVVGTHTHVQTSDNMILPAGTAYMTDLGMTGAVNSILGMSKDKVIERFRTQISISYKVARGPYKIEGAIIEIDENLYTGNKIERIRETSMSLKK